MRYFSTSLKNTSIFSVLCVAMLSILVSSHALAKNDNDELQIKKDSLTLPRSAASSEDDFEPVPMGEPEFPGLCAYRGHVGKYQCLEVSPTDHGPYACRGKNLYYSKVDGDKGCYSCPEGYTRFSYTRKMSHEKACTLRRKGRNAYAEATYEGPYNRSCADGQFKHKGHCKSCPDKTSRKHFMGLDKGKCKVEKPYRCNSGLVLHKSEPSNIWERSGNWIGLKHKKYCGLPFDFVDYAEEIIASEANKEVMQGISILGNALGDTAESVVEKMEEMKQALEDDNLQEAYDILASFEAFEELKKELAESSEHFVQAGNEARQFAITIGFTTDGSLIYGGNHEIGLAIDVGEGTFKKYHAYGFTKGLSISVDTSISVGVWAGAFTDSYTQGYSASVPVAPISYSYSFSAGIAVWSDYYTPKRADGLNQPHFVGLSAFFGAGSGFEFGEYVEVWTDVKDE